MMNILSVLTVISRVRGLWVRGFLMKMENWQMEKFVVTVGR